MSNYAKITNNAIERITSRPKWLDDNGDPVSDAVLQDHGWLPVVYSQPEYDPRLQRVIQLPQSEWAIETTRVVATYDIHEIPIEQIRDVKLQAATDMRWQVMSGGITLPNGMFIETDETSFNRVTSVIAGYESTGLTEESKVSYKAASGFVKLTIAEIKGIAGLMGQHMQACFAAEEAHYEAIDLLETREDIANYDVSTGWPNELTSEN